MEHTPPVVILVTIANCTFNLSDFSNARETKNGNDDSLKIEFKKGTFIYLDGYKLEELNEAFKAASPPTVLSMPQ